MEVKSNDSWAWFPDLLKTNVQLEDGYGYTIMSYQQNVIIVIFIYLFMF